jgi:hypothetical protein
MHHRARRCFHRIATKKGRVLTGLVLGAALAPVLAHSAGAASPNQLTYWTRCSLRLKVASVEVSPVEVRQLTCGQARDAIERARILLTPGGPIFSTQGFTCTSKRILPRTDPSPIELPAAERCTGTQRRQLSFIWDWAS